MSTGQRVIVKGDTVGGWIPVPSEMLDATGISEESILETKVWNKVVPLMRKIGDYVLENYLANDPRKNYIMQWKARYCTGANKRKKEAMISPVVGFVYILDSFKNHRDSTVLGKKRNQWRLRMMRQIAVKSVWKRTHTALAKLIHNPMNMSDQNSAKQFMRAIRKANRDPNLPWASGIYKELGDPGDGIDIDTPLRPSTARKMKVEGVDDSDSIPPPSPPPPPPPPSYDERGERIINMIEDRKPDDVNRTDESGAPPPPPPPDLTGRVPLPAAQQAMKAEEEPGASHSDDDDDDDMPADTGYDNFAPSPGPGPDVIRADSDDDDFGPGPSSSPTPTDEENEDEENGDDSFPPPPPPPPPPSIPPSAAVVVSTEEELPPTTASNLDTNDVTSIPPPPPPSPPPSGEAIMVETDSEEALPGVSGEEDIDPDDAEILLTNGVPPPPPPPPAASAITQRVAELESEIAKLQALIEQQRKDPNIVLSAEREDAYRKNIAQLNEMINKKNIELAKQKAQIEDYERAKQEWDTMKDQLDKTRHELEEEIDGLKSKQEVERAEYEAKLADKTKQIEDLITAKELLANDLAEKEAERKRLEEEYEQLHALNNQIAVESSELVTTEADIGKRAELEERAAKLEREVNALNERIQKNDSEIRKLKADNVVATKQLENAISERNGFEIRIGELGEKHRKEMEELRSRIRNEYEAEKKVLESERDELRAKTLQNSEEISSLQTEIETKNAEIERLRSQISTTEARVRTELKAEYDRKIDEVTKQLESVVREKMDRIKELEADNLSLKNRISDLETQLATVQAENAELSHLIDSLQRQLRDLPPTDEINKLRTTLEQNKNDAANALLVVKQQYDETLRAKNDLEMRLNSSNQSYSAELQRIKESYDSQVANLNQQIAELKHQQDRATTERAKVESTLATLRQQYNALETTQKTNSQTIEQLNQQMANLNAENQNLNEAAKQAKQQTEFLMSLAKQLGVASNSTELEEAVKKLIKASEDAVTTERKLQASLSANTNKTQQLASQIDLQRQQIATLEKTKQDLTRIMGTYNTQNLAAGQTLSGLIEQLTKELNELKSRNQELEQKYNEAVNERGQYQATAEGAQHDMEQMAAATAQLTRDKNEIQQQIEQLQKQNEEAKQKNIKTNQALAAAEQAKAAIEKRIDDLLREKGALQAQIQSIGQQNAQAVERLNEEHARQIAQLQNDLNDKIAKITQLNAEITELRAKIANQNARIAELLKSNEELVSSNLELKAELDRVRELNRNLLLTLKAQAETVSDFSISKRRRNDASSIEQSDIQSLDEPEEAASAAPPQAAVERGDESAMEEPASAVSANPPFAVRVPPDGSTTVIDPITGEEITVYSREYTNRKTGRKQRLFLVIRWDAKTNWPKDIQFMTKRGAPILERDLRRYGIPYKSYNDMKNDMLQFAEEWRQSRALSRRSEHNLNTVEETKRDMSNNSRPGAANAVPVSPVVSDISTPGMPSQTGVYLFDPANLYNVFRDAAFSRRITYQKVLKDLLVLIKIFLDQQSPEYQLAFLTDDNYVPADRLANIQKSIGQETSVKRKADKIFYAALSNVEQISAPALVEGIKYWLKTFATRFRNGNVLEIDPRLVYHTITSIIYDVINPGPESTRLTGFGYEHQNSTGGVVPIPTAPAFNFTPASGLYDYYGYGFNPFLQQLHNPLTYHTQDYSGYY